MRHVAHGRLQRVDLGEDDGDVEGAQQLGQAAHDEHVGRRPPLGRRGARAPRTSRGTAARRRALPRPTKSLRVVPCLRCHVVARSAQSNSRFSTNVSSWISRWSKRRHVLLELAHEVRDARLVQRARVGHLLLEPGLAHLGRRDDHRVGAGRADAVEQHALLRLARVVLHGAVRGVFQVGLREGQRAGRRPRRHVLEDPAQPDEQVVVHDVAGVGRSRGAGRAAAARRSRPRTPRGSGPASSPSRASMQRQRLARAARCAPRAAAGRRAPRGRRPRARRASHGVSRLDGVQRAAAAARFSLNTAIDRRRSSSRHLPAGDRLDQCAAAGRTRRAGRARRAASRRSAAGRGGATGSPGCGPRRRPGCAPRRRWGG